MHPLNPIFAIIIYGIAFITAHLISIKYKIINTNVRYESIDGLRGFLALGVFIHHAAIWHQFLQINKWDSPKSNLYSQLGQTSVAFFFMITAFLFISKLLNTKNKKVDWNILFLSRFFRLVPMYFVSIFVLIIIVMILSNWQIMVGPEIYFKQIFSWLAFTIPDTPDINNCAYTNIINAGVVWSLPYEWLFYFSLPILSLLILKKNTSTFYLLISLLFIYGFYKIKYIEGQHLLSFAGGAISPFLIKYSRRKVNYNSPVFSLIILLCLSALILFFSTSGDFISKLLIIVVFNLIVLGNNVFGILKSSILKFLGEISYSTYLIHGIILFVVMYFFYGLQEAANLSSNKYCMLIFITTPFVVLISFITYKTIERPFMDYSKRINLDKVKDQFIVILKSWGLRTKSSKNN